MQVKADQLQEPRSKDSAKLDNFAPAVTAI
jgi:hypothetical protein